MGSCCAARFAQSIEWWKRRGWRAAGEKRFVSQLMILCPLQFGPSDVRDGKDVFSNFFFAS